MTLPNLAKTALQIGHVTLDEYLEYRFNFFLWRVRNFIFFLTLIFLWLAIYSQQTSVFGYQKDQMLTYIIGVAMLRSIVLGTRTGSIAGEIKTGELTRLILQPINIFFFWASRDIADKFLNIAFSIAEVALIIFLFRFSPHLPTVEQFFFFLVVLFLAVILFFFTSLILSFVAFWTDDIWALRWLVGYVLLEFFSGAIFPIDILPSWITNLIAFTPFPYLIYYPMKVWLGQIPTPEIMNIIGMSLGWIIVTWALALFIWKKGSKNYGAYGG